MQIVVWLLYGLLYGTVIILSAMIGATIGAIFGLFVGPAQLFAWVSNGDSSSSSDTI